MLQRFRNLARPDGGQAAVTLFVVVIAVAVSSYLLYRTMSAAVSINKKAETIRNTAGGINTATASIEQLEQTNATAKSILGTAKELGEGRPDGRVGQIVTLAKSIDSLATSINSTAGTINNTARNINGQAVAILGTARLIAGDVRQINANIDGTLGLANGIKADTGTIVGQARSIRADLARVPIAGG